jgi:hypothetical protein
MGKCVKKVSPVLERLTGTLASYEHTLEILHSPDNLHWEIKDLKGKARRTVLLFLGLLILSILDVGLNYVIFDRVIGEESQFGLWAATLGYGIVLVFAAEGYVILCPDYKDVLSRKSLIVILPLMIVLLSSGFIRYFFETAKEAGGPTLLTLEEVSKIPAEAGRYYRDATIAVFFTAISLLVFIVAVLFTYWQKYGNLTIFFSKQHAARLDERIKRYRKRMIISIDSFYNERISHMINSAQAEIAEYVNGFEHAKGQGSETDSNEFRDYLHWLKTNLRWMVKIEPSSQINAGKFSKLGDALSGKMHHYLRMKNKAIAYKAGFYDAVYGEPEVPGSIEGGLLFHKVDRSIGAVMDDGDMKSCRDSYSAGYDDGKSRSEAHGKK